MFRYVNPNPSRARREDCAVRAVAIALDWTWEKAFIDLAIRALMNHDMPHADELWGECLWAHGFRRHSVPRGCCFNLSLESVPATADPTVVPAPVILLQNANLVITRIA